MRLSVVLSVFNGARSLPATIDSILEQTLRDFELVVVDDGSTDDTPRVLAAYAARDARVRVLTQTNAGLTRALIRGCAAARADTIARHDCGDRSHPDRFARQLELMETGHVLVSCMTSTVDVDGDLLYVTDGDGEAIRDGLLHADASRIRSIPHHGSAMFRREAYERAGGYRAAFRFAQDLDLWIRLAPLGTIGIVKAPLYNAVFDTRSISGTQRDAQLRLTEIAVALRDGGDPARLLSQASAVRGAPASPHQEAAATYFVARCLLAQKNPKGKRLLRELLAQNPWHWRARLALLLS